VVCPQVFNSLGFSGVCLLPSALSVIVGAGMGKDILPGEVCGREAGKLPCWFLGSENVSTRV
jgi:hypothetical protein